MIIRKYNYRLETGTVGTDDDNIASVLYNINRMEMKVSFASSDVKELDDALGELFFWVVDSMVHLDWFMKASGGKTDATTAAAVIATFEDARDIVREVWPFQGDASKAIAVFPKVYKMLLAIVPSILALDAQAVGRV